MKSVIITGPESSGKTTLTQGLSHHYDAPLVPEYARYYLHSMQKDYQYDDVITIARQQSRQWWQYILTQRQVIFIDTWYIVIYVWLDYKYGKVPSFITAALKSWQNECLFLLCKPDIPWKPDPLRENENEREELFQRYLQVMRRYNLHFQVMEGEDRIKEGILYVNQYIGQ